MTVMEIIQIILGTLLAGLFIGAPFILPVSYPELMRVLYKIACFFTQDTTDRYDSNGDYIHP